MTKDTLRPWNQVVHLQSDVESNQTATSIYAIDLGALVADDENVPLLYRRARDDPRARRVQSKATPAGQSTGYGITGTRGRETNDSGKD